MNEKLLLQEFARVVEAPNAVTLFRRSVIDLAIRGRLTEQQTEEGSGLDLIAAIQRMREAIVRPPRGTFEGDESHLDELSSFKLPSNWAWARLDDLATFSAGRTPSRSDPTFWNTGDHHWVSIADMHDGQDLSSTKETVSSRAKAQVFKTDPSPVGTMIMSFKLTIGKISRLAIPAFHNEAIISIKPDLQELEAYLFIVLPERARRGITKGAVKGATLNRASLSDIRIPLPPLAEQHRIVAKVNELMTLFDDLQAAQSEREARRNMFRTTTLKNLVTHDNPNADARFALHHSSRMVTQPEHVADVRKAILNLAAQGRLVRQDSEEQPYTDFVDTGRTGIMNAPATSAKTVIPDRWSRVAIECLAPTVTSGSRGWAKYYSSTGAKFIRAQNIRFGHLLLDDLAHVTVPQASEGTRTRIETSDILIVITGAGVTNPGLVQTDMGEAFVSQHVGLVRLKDSRVAPWLLLCLMSPAGARDELVARAYGSGKPGLNLDNIRSLPVPLPPLAEQQRILTQVDQLMSVCDELERSLAAERSERAHLLEALLRETLIDGLDRAS